MFERNKTKKSCKAQKPIDFLQQFPKLTTSISIGLKTLDKLICDTWERQLRMSLVRLTPDTKKFYLIHAELKISQKVLRNHTVEIIKTVIL